MKSSERIVAVALMLAGLVAGCSCSERRSVDGDAGVAIDAASAPDASAVVDASSLLDATSPLDAAPTDAAPSDAGASVDASASDAASATDAASACPAPSLVATLPGVGTTGSRFATTAGPYEVGCGACPYAALVRWTHPGDGNDYAFCLYVADNPTYIARYDGVAPASCDETPDACTASATRVSVPSSGTHYFLLCRPSPGEVEIEFFSADWPCP